MINCRLLKKSKSDTLNIFTHGFIAEAKDNWKEEIINSINNSSIDGDYLYISWDSTDLRNIPMEYAKHKTNKGLISLALSLNPLTRPLVAINNLRNSKIETSAAHFHTMQQRSIIIGMNHMSFLVNLISNKSVNIEFNYDEFLASYAESDYLDDFMDISEFCESNLNDKNYKKIRLIGHSLGCNLINFSIPSLMMIKEIEFELINLASATIDYHLIEILNKTSKPLNKTNIKSINIYNDEDTILPLAPKITESLIYDHKAIGLSPSKMFKKNHKVSYKHQDYWKNLLKIKKIFVA